MISLFTARVGNVAVVITRVQPDIFGLIQTFYLRYRQPPNFHAPDGVRHWYVVQTGDKKEHRMTRVQFAHFQSFLEQKSIVDYTIEEDSSAGIAPANWQIRPEWKLRDRQPDAVTFITQTAPSPNRLITLPTGYGKSLVTLWALSQFHHRAAYFIAPGYLQKTHDDILKFTTCTKKQIWVIQKAEQIQGLIEAVQNKTLNVDFLLFSIATLRVYIELYLENPRWCLDKYGMDPETLFRQCELGSIVYDEVHQNLNLVYKTMVFANTRRVVGLSGTFLSMDPFITRIQEMMFPYEYRFEAVAMKKYIHAFHVLYHISHPYQKHVSTKQRRKPAYSHVAFEKSMLRHGKLRAMFANLHLEIVKHGFMDRYKPGHKCLILVKMVETAGYLGECIKTAYPQLKVVRYTHEDSYENVLIGDVILSTIGSAGTALDIPNLMTVVLSDVVRSPVANLQTIGRLREPSEGVARFYTLTCQDIPRHVEYLQARRELFQDRVARQISIISSHSI